ncbi:CobW C-terminal domain-containing protein [Pseudoscourfieldia marina]
MPRITWRHRDDTFLDTRVPLMVLTGYLGAGKTTLITNLVNAASPLKSTEQRRLAIIVNELSELDVDAVNIAAASAHSGAPSSDLQQITAGCVCCTQRGGFEKAIRDVVSSDDGPTPRYIVVETSGASDPAPLIASLATSPAVRSLVELDVVVAMLDAGAADDESVCKSVSFQSQLARADVVLMSKCDVTTEEQQRRTRNLAEKYAPQARLLRCDHGRVPLAALFASSPQDNNNNNNNDDDDDNDDGFIAAPTLTPTPMMALHHLQQDRLATTTFQSESCMNLALFLYTLRWLLRESGMEVLRAKGFVRVESGIRLSIQVVGARVRFAKHEATKDCTTRLVFIGAALRCDELVGKLNACVDDGGNANGMATAVQLAHCRLDADARFVVAPLAGDGVRLRLSGHLRPLGNLPPDVVAAANDALAERVGVTDGVYLCPVDDEWMLLIPNALPEGVDACAALSRVAADVLMSMMDRVEL